MIRRPPRSTLFPTRRSSDLFFIGRPDHYPRVKALDLVISAQDHLYRAGPSLIKYRSEEHTSELQSHSDLVCRLLLEKKKKKKKNNNIDVNKIIKHNREPRRR